MSSSIPWPDADIERLKRCVALGVSSGQIALEMRVLSDGRTISRNSVLGKMTRIGLKSHIPPNGPGSLGNGQVTIRKPRPSRAKAVKVSKPKARASLPNPVSLFDVTFNQCRWPLTPVNPIRDFRFCGARKADGCSYCEMHRKMSTGRGTESERRAA